ncbi:MAG TPA: alkaline phosphatase family protein [Verrucomicrobiae bacterium]|jgi:phospholipase C|nr:alkaline phosphatase family protein [Verrucomicrobiae bacterium]
MRQLLATTLMAVMTFGPLANANAATPARPAASSIASTTTPIQHLVVIFQENVSFDHYFGTYPNATNPAGEPPFTPAVGTPNVNGIQGGLTTNNPNLNPGNGTGATNPFRLDRSQAATNDQDHDYTPEQLAFDKGLMDLFPANVGVAGPPPGGGGIVDTTGLTMGYYDGNTVTALWNYAQNFAMSDNSYDTNFGPSTDGALNLVSGQTNGVVANENGSGAIIADGNGGFTLISDADPIGDSCSTTSGEVLQMGGRNIGDMLNTAGISWGFFEGGFDLTITNPNGSTGCQRSHTSTITGQAKADYIPHHQPFQYYVSTQNLHHTRPTSVATIGQQGDAGNHQYDTHDFFDAINAGNFPAVSFLKAPGYQDGHAGYSDPLDEQTFIVDTINFLSQTQYWGNTAVVIAYDDSDGWYDHQLGQILNTSQTTADGLTGTNQCGTVAPQLAGIDGPAAQGRCGYGPRLPLMVVSPYARKNFVDHTMTDQTSIIRFIEDNWLNGERVGNGSFDAVANSIASMMTFANPSTCLRYVLLNDSTGEVTGTGCARF